MKCESPLGGMKQLNFPPLGVAPRPPRSMEKVVERNVGNVFQTRCRTSEGRDRQAQVGLTYSRPENISTLTDLRAGSAGASLSRN